MVKIVLRLIVLVSVPLLLAFGVYVYLNSIFFQAANPRDLKTRLVEISPDMYFKQVCKLLEDQGIVKDSRSLYLTGRLQGTDTQIKAGEYELSPSMTPNVILAKLVSGEVFKRRVTVREGASIWEIGPLLEEAGLISQDDWDKAMTDPGLLARAGISSASFEGYLFPDTYFFSRPAEARNILWTMLVEAEKKWSNEFTDRSDALGMSRHEILTLASIIEKESGNFDEQPVISSVFHNRLAKGMKLQSDPTVIYGLPDFNGNLTKADLSNPHPYNTYVNFGLPPGPICNPGQQAVNAALYPTDTNYLYFVADGKGGHIFSTTLKDHNNAVNKYQRKRSSSASKEK